MSLDLDLLAVFVTIAEARSFTAAAERLKTTKATVSRSLARLEEELGTELVHRTTRHLSLSTAGTALYERVAPHVTALRDAAKELPGEDEQPAGELRITAPVDLGDVLLPEVLSRLALRYPAVHVDARMTNDVVDLVAEGFDLAIRMTAGKLKDSSLTARKLGPTGIAAYASPAYVARRGAPRDFGDDGHEWLLHAATRRDPRFKKTRPRLVTNDMILLRETARAGMGVALIPTFMAAAPVAAGELVRVATSTKVVSGAMLLVYPSSGQVARKVEVFRDVLVETLRQRPLPA